ncbi:MAG: CpsB/CapC family capsule biosynthesis tyrosine phosphatase [Chitinophagales bacterium]
MGWLQNFFGKKEEIVKLHDLGALEVDLHSHLIPGIDDGVKTVDEAVAVIEQLIQLGFKKIITTPHVVTDGYNNSNDTILRGCDEVREALLKKNISIPFSASAEYYVDETLLPKIKAKSLLPLFKDYVLIELSYVHPPLSLTGYIYDLRTAGYNVILAHPERYPFYYRKDISAFEEVRDLGVFFQVNLGSLCGVYGRGAQQAAEMLIDADMIDFVATDIHNMKLIPVFHKALELPYVRKIIEYDFLKNKQLL